MTDSWQQTKARCYHTVKLYQYILMHLRYNRLAQDIIALKTWKPKAVPLDNLSRTRAHHKTCPILNFSEPKTAKSLQEPSTPKRKLSHSSLQNLSLNLWWGKVTTRNYFKYTYQNQLCLELQWRKKTFQMENTGLPFSLHDQTDDYTLF